MCVTLFILTEFDYISLSHLKKGSLSNLDLCFQNWTLRFRVLEVLEQGRPTLVAIWEHFPMWLNFMQEDNEPNEEQRAGGGIL